MTNIDSKTHQLEVIEQSPIWLRASINTMLATAAFGICWLALAKTEEIVVAPGKLEPIGAVKKVKVPIGGVVDQILVKEGERVKKGQILLRLDTEASSDRQESITGNIGFKRQQLSLKQEELRRYLDLNSTEQKVLRENLKLQKDILNRYQALAQEGAGSELQVLQQRDKFQQQQGELAKRVDDRERQRAQLSQQIVQLKTELGDLGSSLTEQNVRLRYQEIRSPVDGMVFDLKPSAPGFVANDNEPVLQLVPFDALHAKVDIPSSDIGFVSIGQNVDLSIDSFPATDFGVLEGRVKHIGSDAIPPDQSKGQADYRFPADIKLNSQQLDLKNGKSLRLQAGMSLTANIKLRSVTYLQLLLGSFKNKTDSLKQL
ncbi:MULTISPECIES: HlyD family secretion protein [unclassified Prochlorococcus]|uniref:HlyD family secretion protein n=1 Tax=unclassified Prochlorococcus TaxID=2627481 RepID=UPI000A9C0830|nr:MULTISPECIES: HlyD family efflux transporter periplasmic adaptor subunit [unclassified Prochlorococcus]